MTPITHVIFDTIGTILDTEVIVDILTEYAVNNGKHMKPDIKS